MRPISFIPHGRAALSMLSIVLTVSLSAATPAGATDLPFSRATLKGIKAVEVDVTLQQAGTERGEVAGLAQDQLRADVEQRLRHAGVSVVPGRYSNPELLQVTVNFADIAGVQLMAVSFTVECLQGVLLVRDRSIMTWAPTWSVAAVGSVGAERVGEVRGPLGGLVDQFINAYLEQNPKP